MVKTTPTYININANKSTVEPIGVPALSLSPGWEVCETSRAARWFRTVPPIWDDHCSVKRLITPRNPDDCAE